MNNNTGKDNMSLKSSLKQLLETVRTSVSGSSHLGNLILFGLAIFISMSLVSSGRFLSLANLSSMSYQFPALGFLALAIMISFASGGIDLSVVATANLTAIVAASVFKSMPGAPMAIIVLVGLAAALGTGLAAGSLNGFLIGVIGVPPILATLGTLQLYTGISIIITKGSAIHTFPGTYLAIGNGSLLSIPAPLIIFVSVAALLILLFRKTAYGHKLFMVGSNPIASLFSAIDNKRIIVRTYLLTASLSTIAGFILTSRTNAAKPGYGHSYLLQAILIALLGGVNPNGGYGSVVGTVVALVSLQFLSSGFNILGLRGHFSIFLWGLLLILVIVLNYYQRERETSTS